MALSDINIFRTITFKVTVNVIHSRNIGIYLMNNIYINTDIHYLRHELFKRFRLSPIGDE